METPEAIRPGQTRTGPGAILRVVRRVLLGLSVVLLSAVPVSAQATPATEPPPGTTLEGPVATASPHAAPDYFFPDLAAGALVHDGKLFRI